MSNGDININECTTAEYADSIISAGRFEKGILTPGIGSSTLTADNECEAAFNSEQTAFVCLGDALNNDGENIRSVGHSFGVLDATMAQLVDSGAWNEK